MLSVFLLLLLATTGLAMPQPTLQSMPQPTPDLAKRNATANSTRNDCMKNCTTRCGHGEVCDLICAILKCPRNMKRADLSGEFKKEGVATRSEDEEEEEEWEDVEEEEEEWEDVEEEEDGFEDVEVVETGRAN